MATSLPGLDPAVGQYTAVRFVDPQVKQAIADEMKRRAEKEKRAKLTWATPQQWWARRGARGFPGDPQGPDGFDRKLPWMSTEGRYYVQNCRVFNSAFVQIKLSEVPNIAIRNHTCALCEDRPEGPCTYQEYVGRQLEAYIAKAIQLDPMLCKYCHEHTADTPDEFAEHLASVHPEKLGQRLGLGNATPKASSSSGFPSFEGGTAEATPPPPPPLDVPRGTSTPAPPPVVATSTPIPVSIVPPVRVNPDEGKQFICGEIDCGRIFLRNQDLKRHLTTTHNKRG